MKIAVLLVISCFIAAAYSESLSKLLLLLSITINDKRLSIGRANVEETFAGKYHEYYILDFNVLYGEWPNLFINRTSKSCKRF